MKTESLVRTVVFMVGICVLVGNRAQAQTFPHFVGQYSGKPVTLAGEDNLYFLAVAFDGPFTFEKAREAWHWGVAHVVPKGSLITRRNDYRTDNNHHIVIGWFNKTENNGRWIAATNWGKLDEIQRTGGFLNPGSTIKEHSVVGYIVFQDANHPHKDAGAKAEWIKRSYTTRGYHIQLSVACDDDTGAVAACFDPPQ